MALPADVGTFTLTGGSFTDVTGATALAGMKGTLTPVDGAGRPMNVTHAASGKVIVPIAVPIDIQDDGTWSLGPLPYTNDPALAGAFRYKVSWNASASSPTPGNKIFEVPAGSGSTIDFDLLGSSTGTLVTPVAVPLVTSVVGKSGAITGSDIAADASLRAAFGLVVNVKSPAYGAKGDGSTDDTAAIQAAIDAVAASGGGIVFLPAGSYVVTSLTLKAGVILSGGRTVHGYVPGAIGGVKIIGSSGTVIDTPTGSIVGAGVVGLDVSGSTTTTTLIHFRDASWCAVRSVGLDSCTASALQIDAGTACVIEDILVTNAMLNRAPASLTGAVDISGTDHYFTRCEVSTSELGISTGGNVAAWAIRGSNNFVGSCVGEISDLGWYVLGDNNRFVGCRGDSNWGGDWNITGGGNLFTACTAMNSGRAVGNTYDGFTVSGLGNSFSSCAANQPGSNTYRYGFNDSVNTSSATSRNQYAACNGTGYATALWNTQGYLGSAPTIAGTPIRVSSGATIDVTGAQLVYLDYSAATTVTAFTGAAEGQHIYLIGNSNVTIQAGSGIYTRTGANRTLTANVLYHFVNYNGGWFETA